MRLAVCIPARGKPEVLLETIRRYDATAARADTVLAVGLDEDDASRPGPPATGHRLIWHASPRCDSVGAKYNELWRLVEDEAEGLVLAGDDLAPATMGWDEELAAGLALFTDGVGCIGVVAEDSRELPVLQAITTGMAERLEYFATDFFPVWFTETWADEVGRLSDRMLFTNAIRVEETAGRGRSLGLRDVHFWWGFFEATRRWRARQALELVRGLEPPFRIAKIEAMHPRLMTMLEARNAPLGDRTTCSAFERELAAEDGCVARHERLKRQACGILEQLQKRWAA